MQENHEIHIGKEIQKKLTAEQRSVAWLAGQLCCDASCLRKQFKKSYISTDLLYRISKILHKDFFIFYSQRL
ncbi:MAG: XRE family transcriptional regulator [Bacteroidetes bacterium]|nr:XRE family transcriptional regulator [Bacteroidota bacterium]